MNMKRALSTFLVLASFATVACGSAPPPKVEEPTADDGAGRPAPPPVPQVAQELGSIDQRAVEQTFNRLEGPLEKCHQEGRDRVEYLTGDVKVFLRVDQAGKVRYAYFEESTLGDHETEACILALLGRTTWPKPQGGEAEIRNGFGWGPGGERAPTPWGPEKVIDALADAKDVKKDVAKCRSGVKGDFVVTAYVEHDDSPEPPAAKNHKSAAHKKNGKRSEKAAGGKFKALGVSPPSKDAADKVECIVEALMPLRLPTPGSYPAKVSFAL
jgi:hypothetical protein